MDVWRTPDGVEFGSWGRPPAGPAPTLLCLSSTIADAFEPAFRQAAAFLEPAGYLCVSVDLPCHGGQVRSGVPEGLSGWAQLAAAGDDFVAAANARLASVVDYLIDAGLADRNRIVASGTSRGGFLALRYAAHDARIAGVVGYAPVTDLSRLSEFGTVAASPLVAAMSLNAHVDELCGRPVFVVIGDRDERVGTDAAVDFAQRLSDAAARADRPSQVTLLVLSEPRGHTTPPDSDLLAALWIHRTLGVADGFAPAFADLIPSSR